jgi:cytochrome bd ubiquinol oxidase subunit I
MFAFFAESVFLAVFLLGRDRVSPRVHWVAALMVFRRLLALGLVHHRHERADAASRGLHGSGGNVEVESFWARMTNPGLPWPYLHTMARQPPPAPS